ncbi:MAG: putative rane protein [Herbinix sp.]|jgi:uncharacterized membrane protein YesL|nr:putative rane protein [Herbinix sp.]
MGNLFNMDNGIFAFLGKVFDILLLSIIWLICCIPIITIGPANTALYYATVKVIRRERGYLFQEFMKSFRLNFKRGAIVGVLLTLIYTILAFDLIWSWAAWETNSKGSPLFGIFIAITFILFCFSIYVFPVLSRFDMKFKQLMKVTILMCIKHLPSTIAMAVILAASIIATNYFLVLIFILPAASTYLNSLLMERIFKKYMPTSDGPGEDTGKDEWYLE